MGFDLLALATSFAARAHAGQMRKDGRTPYIAHPMRVCLALSIVFNVSDPEVLAAALLHDTIEDTSADFDDLNSEFGVNVANLVAAMTKDQRLPEDERERRYVAQINQGGWRVQVLKLADIYDNLGDLESLPADKRKNSLRRARFYLSAMKSTLAAEAQAAFEIVRERFAAIEIR